MQFLQQQMREGMSKGPSRDDAVLVNLRKKCLDMQARLQELRDHLMQLRDSVGPDRHDNWYTFLQKYDTINKTAATLCEELDRSLTIGHDNFVTVPAALTADPAELPDFLRTKLDPEVERDFDTLTSMYTSLVHPTAGSTTISGGGHRGGQHQQHHESATVASGSLPVGDVVPTNAAVSGRIEIFNDMIDKVLEEFDEKRLVVTSERSNEPPPPTIFVGGETVIAALTTGKGL